MARLIRGRINADVYHNEAVRAARMGDFALACEIVEEGLKSFPNNTDLLADSLLYYQGDKDGNYNVKTKIDYLAKLKKIDFKQFSWRAFDFAIDFIVDDVMSQNLPEKEREEFYDIARELAIQFIKQYPYDERSYLALSKVLLSRNDPSSEGIMSDSDLVEYLYKSVTLDLYTNRRKEKDSDSGVPEYLAEVLPTVSFPVCVICVRYADLLLERGNYQEAIDVANIGLVGSAQEQPSSDPGYLVYTRALSRDALIHRMMLSPESYEVEVFCHYVDLALKDYELASKLFGGEHSSAENIRKRCNLLKALKGTLVRDEEADSGGEAWSTTDGMVPPFADEHVDNECAMLGDE